MMPEAEPLGSLLSWMRDATLGGAILPVGILLTLLGFGYIQNPGVGWPNDLVEVLSVASLAGALVGLILAPAAHLVARLAWRIPLAALALGPLLGSISAWSSVWIVARLFDHRPPRFSANEILALLGYGAFAVSPPWVAYLSVRSRGRSGLGVVVASVIWASAAVLTLFGLDWLRRL